MSGHSKWSTIKHKKAANDAVRSGIFTKFAQAISIATKTGGSGDPEKNFSLRLAMEKARGVNMPKEKIERAIEKGLGKVAGEELVELVIEGYGPSGMAVIILCLTNNRNRTVSEVKNLLEKNGGRMGEPGSVMYLFERVGLVSTAKQVTDEDELSLIDIGLSELTNYEEGALLSTEIPQLQTVIQELVTRGYPQVEGEIGYKAKTLIRPASEVEAESFLRLLSDHPDVQEVYANI